jgi:hypothetical protein
MRVFKYWLLLYLWVTISTAYPQSAGTTSFEFIRSQYSPRGAAMGGNLMAVKSDIQAALYNPAALAGNPDRLWGISYTDHLLDFKAGHLAYSQPYRNWGNFNGSLLYFNYGNFNETDEFGDRTGRTFSAAEFALSLGYSNSLGGGFDYGTAIKFLYSSLDKYNASAMALDAGLIYTISGTKDLTFGVSLANLGFTLDNYTTKKEKLPFLFQLGFAKRLEHLPLLFTASFQDMTLNEDHLTDFLERFAIGGEFDISQIIKFRLGYQNQINQDIKPVGRTILSGISLGLGILWRQFRLDYAYSNFGDLGSQNRIGINGSL